MSNRKTTSAKLRDKVTIIKKAQERVLRNLAEYKFLTVSNLVNLRAGIKGRVYDALTPLIEKGYIKQGFLIKRGQVS